MNATRAVVYLRASTEEQRLGPEAQRAACQAWASKAGVAIVAEHADLGVSGGAALEDRPGLVAALGALRELGAGLLIVAKRDRLARDAFIALSVERVAAPARVVSADGVANGADPADRLLRSMLDAVGEFERSLIRQRTRAALAAKKARGERTGGIPFGSRLGAGGALEPEPLERAIIDRVRELRASGLSVRAVADALALAGVCSPRSGRPLGKSQVARLS